MLCAGTGYFETSGKRFEITIPDGSEAARFLLAAPTSKEAQAMEADKDRLAIFRGALGIVNLRLFGALMLQGLEQAFAEGGDPGMPEPSYGTCNTAPELGLAMPEWFARNEIQICIVGQARWQHQPILDLMRVVDRNGWAALVGFLTSGFAGEPVSAAIMPRQAIEAFLKRATDQRKLAPLLPIQGFTGVFVTFANRECTRINHLTVYPL